MKFAVHTSLCPQPRNNTRWGQGSIYRMLVNATEAESDEDEDDVHINFLDETLDEAAAVH